MTTWIKEPDELAELVTAMSFGGVNEVAEALSDMLKDRITENPDYDMSDQVNIADLLWSWASSRMEAIQAERDAARQKAELAKKSAA